MLPEGVTKKSEDKTGPIDREEGVELSAVSVGVGTGLDVFFLEGFPLSCLFATLSFGWLQAGSGKSAHRMRIIPTSGIGNSCSLMPRPLVVTVSRPSHFRVANLSLGTER